MNRVENTTDSDDSENGDEEIIYAFSSVSREVYIRDIYNSLALPPQFTIEFRYRKSWCDNNVVDWAASGELKGKDVVIIAAPFTEYESDTDVARDVLGGNSRYGFYPLRRAKIAEVQDPGGVLYLSLRLTSQLVDYTTESRPTDIESENKDPWEIAEELDRHPEFGIEERDQDVFLSHGQDIFEYSGATTDLPSQDEWTTDECEEKWNMIVRWLGDTESLSESLFYRIESVKKLKSETAIVPEKLFGSKNVGYQIDAGKQYLLRISISYAGSPPKGAQDAMLSIDVGNKVQVLPPSFNLGFRTERKELIIDPNTGAIAYNSSLSFKILSEFNHPAVDIPIRVEPDYYRRFGPQFLLIFEILIIICNAQIISILDALGQATGLSIPIQYSDGVSLLQLVGTGVSIIGMQFYAAARDIDV
jgi:hypothetical protein